MKKSITPHFDTGKISTPYYIVEEKLIKQNLEILKDIKERTGCKILLAQKAFSMFSLYPLLSQYLDGTTASGLFEARLGYEKFGKEVHIFSPAYKEEDFEEILQISDHIVFNSYSNLKKFGGACRAKNKSIGVRINPECSTQADHEIYDPCAKFSRLGITLENFQKEDMSDIDGLHFHTLCQQNSDDLETTLNAVEEKFGSYLSKLKWLNFGGGHHITRADYDRDRLVRLINHFQERYSLRVYLEPGEAVALNAGFLVSSVIDIIENNKEIAILDTSAACHMPDVLEMPYRPEVIGSGEDGEKPYSYRFAGPTCLAGDIIGDYSFDEKLEISDKVVFCDMAIYSMVKNNTFNGINLPSIAILREDGSTQLIKSFGYSDFLTRLS